MCSLASVTEIFLPPKLRALLLGCTGGRKVVHNGKQHSAGGVPVKLPEAKAFFFFSSSPCVEQSSPMVTNPTASSQSSQARSAIWAVEESLAPPRQNSSCSRAESMLKRGGGPFTPCPTNTPCDRLCLATRSCQGQRVLSCTITSGYQGRP